MDRHSAYRAYAAPTYSTAGKPRELDVLKLLACYDLLPSSFIQHELGNYEATKQTLRNLVKGHYIGLPNLPREEKLAYIPRNAFYVYELKDRGKTLLARQGHSVTQGGNDHYKHRLLRSEIEYLLDRAPLQVKGVADILNHRACPLQTRDAPHPFRIPMTPTLAPDITRGLGDGESFIFLHIEVDRGTEPVLSQNMRQSLKSKIERYSEYLQTGFYQAHFGFAVPPSVLFITTRGNTDSLMLAIQDFSGKWSKRFFVTTVQPKPLPTTNLFVPWQGVDGTLDLMEKFNGLSKESGPRERVGEGDKGT